MTDDNYADPNDLGQMLVDMIDTLGGFAKFAGTQELLSTLTLEDGTEYEVIVRTKEQG